MSSYQTAMTDRSLSLDHRLREQRLELQVSILAGAVRVLAHAIEEHPAGTPEQSAALKRVEEMLHDAQL
jgi:hypothetical protein